MSSHGHLSLKALAPRSKLYQGPFGRICPDLPPAKVVGPDGAELTGEELDTYLRDIADNRMSERPGEEPGDLDNPDDIADLETEFSSNIPAGYTYFGQFIDHDITFDPASSLMRRNDPNGLVNFRTPRLDLDCVYGRGPDDQPYLYRADKKRMLTGTIGDGGLRDLPRNTPMGDDKARALIGDMRNDENAIVSQLQLAFLLAHNTLVDRAEKIGVPKGEQFEAARKTLRWLYQWILWHDFLPRVVLSDTWACAMKLEPACGGRKRWVFGLSDVYNWSVSPFMPVEFSVAAYRFGHSMVRNAYQTNNDIRGFGNFAPIFANSPGDAVEDLSGFRPMAEKNIAQWDWFLPMKSSRGPFPQMARRIDTKLANALLRLHERDEPPDHSENVLAFRNLKRSWTFDLPSGPDMARKYCLPVIPLEEHEPTLLWYYLLREAEVASGSENRSTLGPLGSLILCAVFSGLLKGDPCAWVNMEPCWTPDSDPLLCGGGGKGADNCDDASWTLASIIRLAGLPVEGGDVNAQKDGTYPDTTECLKAPETKSMVPGWVAQIDPLSEKEMKKNLKKTPAKGGKKKSGK